jgi:glyoxylase-like metal-dependent hydrolase (beta-lactamase superfamily II)
VALACLASRAVGQVDFEAIELETVDLGSGLYVLMGGPAQGNILASIGPDGIFLVDSMYAPMHGQIVAALTRLSDQPIRYVVNTHQHGDHTAGNEAMAQLGATIISHENMRQRLEGADNPVSAGTLPELTYSDDMTLHFNGDEIYIYNPGPAHTDGDSIIFFRNANVMHVGDVPSSLRYPNIGINDGGTVDGMMAAARQIMEIANADTRIIPGHLGPVVGFSEIEPQLTMFDVVGGRILNAILAGQSLEEVVDSKPTLDFDPPRLAGAITPDRFVTLVYTDLARGVD